VLPLKRSGGVTFYREITFYRKVTTELSLNT
jgi:hypothetical protein